MPHLPKNGVEKIEHRMSEGSLLMLILLKRKYDYFYVFLADLIRTPPPAYEYRRAISRKEQQPANYMRGSSTHEARTSSRTTSSIEEARHENVRGLKKKKRRQADVLSQDSRIVIV